MKKHPSWRFGYGLWIYETRPQAPQTGGNIYYDGALPYPTEDAVVVKDKPDVRIEEKGDEVFLYITISPEQAKAKTQLVTTKLLGKAQVPDLPFEDYDGSPLKIDTDYFGQKRDLENPSPGPFEKPGSGRLTLKVWPNLKEKGLIVDQPQQKGHKYESKQKTVHEKEFFVNSSRGFVVKYLLCFRGTAKE